MIGLIFGETNFPIEILKKIKKRKLNYLIVDLIPIKWFVCKYGIWKSLGTVLNIKKGILLIHIFLKSINFKISHIFYWI